MSGLNMDENVEDTSGMDRRSMLRKAAMGSAFVWATPVVQTLGTRVAAAATQNFVGCPEGGGGTPPKEMVFRWTGDACSASDGDAFVSVTGNTGAIAGNVDISATHGTGANAGSTALIVNIAPGDTFTLGDGVKKMNPETTITIFETGTSNILRTVTIHTSCSQPLLHGDTYCGMTLIGGF